VWKAVSTVDDVIVTDDVCDAKTASLNPVVVSMLLLPLLQIVSLPRTAVSTVTDCRLTAKQLLSTVSGYTVQHTLVGGCHRNAESLVLPTAASHTCCAYVQLARCLSDRLHSDNRDDVSRWLQQVCGSVSADHQPSSFLTLLSASLFFLCDDASTVDNCLQLLHAICLSDKTQVCLDNL